MKIKTALCHTINDDISTLSLDTIEIPAPEPEQVQVRQKACADNFPDILMIQGKYQFKPQLPFAPGGEFSGDIIAVGNGVTGFKVGDRVVGSDRSGGFSEAINLPASQLKPIPGDLSYAKAATYSTAYLTAFVALTIRGNLRAGETLLVHGATGGVGMAAVDLGKYLGATVIATGGTDEKLSVVKARGADHVINYSQPDGSLGGFRDTVKELTQGNGADVIYDPVGGSVFDESMRCINWGGRILAIGFTSGVWPKAAVNHVLIKQISVIGVRAGEIGRRDPVLGLKCRQEIYRLLADGLIDPHVCAGFPLESAVDALKMLEQRKVVGKCVVTMNGYSLETSAA